MMAMMMKSTKRQPGCQSCPTGLSVRDYTEQPSFKKEEKKERKKKFSLKPNLNLYLDTKEMTTPSLCKRGA